MEVGENVSRSVVQNNAHKIYEDIWKCLSQAHTAGVMHCDVRLDNILLFASTYQLIDFGLSVKISQGTVILDSDSNQAKGAGPEIRRLLTQRFMRVPWTESNDYSMFVNLMLGILV